MMAAQKHSQLHELLREDQEPFLLKHYIADRRCQLKKANPLQLNQHKPKHVVDTTTASASSTRILCNHACLFSLRDSPDVRKSPLFDFPSPAKSPGKAQNTVFLHIPARTAAMLLDAAARIQKQSYKPKSDLKNFGLFGSILKRLKDRSTRTKRRELGANEVTISGSSLAVEKMKSPKRKGTKPNGTEVVLSYENSRLSSADWSDRSNDENKSLDLETSCSSRSDDSVEIEESENHDFGSCENCFCSSPSSPFRFSLQKSASPDRRTPDFLSPAASPVRHFKEEKLETAQVQEEEEKEQFSPVSVLDPSFEDDEDEGHEGGDEEDHGYDLECSYASVQRAKHLLLQKLRRFERLAELDPVELEKRMLEQQDVEEDDEDPEEEGEHGDYDSGFLCEEKLNEFVREVFVELGVHPSTKIPSHMMRLVSDLIAEENKIEEDSEAVAKRVCKRLDSWKELDPNTIDMMVETDFRREADGWKRYDEEEIRATRIDIEVAIFGLLVEELSEELLSFNGHE